MCIILIVGDKRHENCHSESNLCFFFTRDRISVPILARCKLCFANRCNISSLLWKLYGSEY